MELLCIREVKFFINKTMHCFGVLKCYCVCSYSTYFVRLLQYTELSVIDTMHLMEISKKKKKKKTTKNQLHQFLLPKNLCICILCTK